MARSVADKVSKRKGVPLLLLISTAILARFNHSTDDIANNMMSQKEVEKTGMLFIKVGALRGHTYGGWG